MNIKRIIAALGLTVAIAVMCAAIAPAAYAQATSTDTTTATPGTPTTGAGGMTGTNITVIILSGLVVIGGVAYLINTARRDNMPVNK